MEARHQSRRRRSLAVRPPCLRAVFALAFVMAASLFSTVAAEAELSQHGDLIVAFDGSLQPTKLPREQLAPVAVSVAGDFHMENEGPLPQLRKIKVAINSAGRLYDKGLPTCEVEAIQPATERQARAECKGAIVGSGNVALEVKIPSQAPFPVEAKVLVFNGPRHGGQKQILAQAYAEDPPGAFVLTFEVKEGEGLFGTVLTTRLPKPAWDWAYLTHFDMVLKRIYRYRGERRSYVSAACAAPDGFPGAVFPFAKANYRFDNGQSLTTTVVRSCKVKADN